MYALCIVAGVFDVLISLGVPYVNSVCERSIVNRVRLVV